MKQIFTLLLAMGMAATAMAGGRQPLSSSTLKAPAKNFEVANLAIKAPQVMKAPAYASAITSLDELEGNMTWSFLDLGSDNDYLSTSLCGVFVMDDEIGEIGIEILPQAQGFELVKAYVDFEAGTISIPNYQLLGADEYGDVYFYVKDVNLETGYINDGMADMQATVGTITDNVVEFPEFDIWATGDPANEQYGYFYITAYNSFTFEGKDEPVDDPDWEAYAVAEFVDGWAIPAMQGDYDQYQFPWDVNVQRFKSDHNVIRIVNPYNVATCPFATSHYGKSGYIVIDVTDPDYVLVCPGYFSGFDPDGSMKVNFFNLEGFYAAMGITKDQVLSNESIDITPSSFDGTTVELRNLCFNLPGYLDQVLNWEGKAGKMHGRLTIKSIDTGIESVETEATETTNAIYDLSGRRLNKVATPGLYIINGQKVIK